MSFFNAPEVKTLLDRNNWQDLETLQTEAKKARKRDLMMYHPDKWVVQNIRLTSHDTFGALLAAHGALKQILEDAGIDARSKVTRLSLYRFARA